MNPELLSSLAVIRRRDLDTAATARRRRKPAARNARPAALPKFRVSWSHTSLAAVAGSRRSRSVVIVISATRTN
jgi:hypothetical protein